VVVDVRGRERLFGSASAIAEQIAVDLAMLGYQGLTRSVFSWLSISRNAIDAGLRSPAAIAPVLLSRSRRERRHRAMAAQDFYEPALLPDERVLYRKARAEHGLSGEVALLRLRLHRLLVVRAETEGTEDGVVTTQLLRIVDLLVKALRAHGSGPAEEQASLERALDEEALRILGNANRK
jgi:hypothetical protein